MTDLTEYTWYYCKMKNGDIQMLERGSDYFLSGDVPLLNDEVKEVLAEVPSYEEWQRLKEFAERLEKTQELELEVRKENKQLKGLLKECRIVLDFAKDFAYHDPCCKCITKINQALREDDD